MKYFSIEKLTKSDKASELGLSNTPNEIAVNNLRCLVNRVLDPLREAYGKPIDVNSGYRCPELNAAVKGNAKSQHLRGEAADITGGSIAANQKLFSLAQELELPYDQLIDEHGFEWLHISHKAILKANRGMILHLE